MNIIFFIEKKFKNKINFYTFEYFIIFSKLLVIFHNNICLQNCFMS
jgi:hypothetical protein